MDKNQIDFSHVKKALDSLEDSINQPHTEYIRDSVIKRFEYSYELSWKILKRYLSSDTNYQFTSIKDLYRDAGSSKLIDDVEEWFEFHDFRNLTTHTYSEEISIDVYEIAPNFLKCAKELISRLEKRIAGS